MFQPTTLPAFIIKVKGQDLFLGARTWMRVVPTVANMLTSDAMWWDEKSATRHARKCNRFIANGSPYFVDRGNVDTRGNERSSIDYPIEFEVVQINATFSA